MWPFSRTTKARPAATSPILFTNTLSGHKEPFTPQKPGTATLYSCGPTVYSQAHVGNLRAYVFSDLIARTLAQAGYHVRRVINITDVGHLTGDSEGDPSVGEDKMEKSARDSGQTAAAIATRYTRLFLDDLRALNLPVEEIRFPRATEYLDEQVRMIKTLETQGHTYRTSDGIYFDTATFPGYGKLGGVPQDVIKHGLAVDLEDRIGLAAHGRIAANTEKRHAADFALWKFSPSGTKRQQEWDSPWGRGFPGWHIECSAMSKTLLGETLDIHTGGMDHIPIHHNNEIAQSESANGKPFVRYFMHNAFLTMDTAKVSKSLGNVVYLADISARGYHPLALRYLFLQAHYRSPQSFSWQAVGAAHEALARLWRIAIDIKREAKGVAQGSDHADRIIALLRDDLATPAALALLWETVRDDSLSAKVIWGAIAAADAVLGLSLTEPPQPVGALAVTDLPADVRTLVSEREVARRSRDFAKADELRIHIQGRGYHVEDHPEGPAITKV